MHDKDGGQAPSGKSDTKAAGDPRAAAHGGQTASRPGPADRAGRWITIGFTIIAACTVAVIALSVWAQAN